MIRLIGAGARPGIEIRELHTFWTVPNLITILRFLLVPLFVLLIAQHQYAATVITLVILGSTDWVDGYFARRLNQVSTVGKWLDPVADRLALVVVAATFVVDGIAPPWLVYVIVIPDAVLITYGLSLFHGNPNLPVSNIGKIRTALLLVGTPLLLLYRVPGFGQEWLLLTAHVILIIGCLGHLVAWYGYMVGVNRKYHRKKRLAAGDAKTVG